MVLRQTRQGENNWGWAGFSWVPWFRVLMVSRVRVSFLTGFCSGFFCMASLLGRGCSEGLSASRFSGSTRSAARDWRLLEAAGTHDLVLGLLLHGKPPEG